MFEEIALHMTAETGKKITASNCENRWKHLERMYKKYIDNNKQTGRGRRDFEYAEVMDDILGHKKNIKPLILLSSNTVSSLTEKGNVADKTVDSQQLEAGPSTMKTNEPAETTCTAPKAKISSTNKTKKYRADILAGIRKDRMRYYDKRLEIEKQKLEEKIKRHKLLEERNNLLKISMEKEQNCRLKDTNILD
ncbi:myb/sant-like dna-binding domain [Holotrichia oblita]|uniref:Myb/sant-like dna-binding domain n=1 Tax=Holotrichia oblita TaxID=644536 RepID=A0ACB9TXB2_HOLOL|nr:myb/sant-like dna-binding domain [Holotrichia oblita]